MRENNIAELILDAAFRVHTNLGPGLLESVYEVILAHELRKSSLAVERQRSIAIHYDGLTSKKVFVLTWWSRTLSSWN